MVLNGFGKPEEIEAAREGVAKDYGVRVDYSPADMSSPASIAEMIETTSAKIRRGSTSSSTMPASSMWRRCRTFRRRNGTRSSPSICPPPSTPRGSRCLSMIANRWGRIINIASAHGLVGSAYKSAYVAAKHGILGLTKVTALEVAEAGITCNAICPGYVYTPLVEAQIEGQAKSHGIPREQVIRDVLLAQQPNKRFATVEELGAFSVFLASDAAASITGTSIAVDGGWTAH